MDRFRRWTEAAGMLMVAALAATLYGLQTAPAPPPPELRQAPRFSLPDVRGGTAVYRGGEGPLLLLLTSSSCGECVRRGHVDGQAYDLAASRGIPAWSILAWTSDEEAPAFLETSGQRADRFLLDADASVAVHRYGLHERASWVLIDRMGRIVWQGAPDLDALAQALAGIPLPSGQSSRGPGRLWHDS